MATNTHQLGIMFRRELPPEQLSGFAEAAEAAGFDELWVVEDCFWASGIAPTAVALASTQQIRVGLGIMPAVVRNPVFTAMEIATLARMYPGRFLPGIGHGVAGWMEQIGALPSSQMTALRETVETVQALLDGQKVNYDGDAVQLNDAELIFPPQTAPPLSLGVRGPKSLQLAGEIAGGTILAEYCAPAFVTWAVDQIEIGRAKSKRSEPHRLTVYALCCVADDPQQAYAQVRPYVARSIAKGRIDAQLEPLGILPEAAAMREAGTLDEALPDEWLVQLTVAGTPSQCVEAIHRYYEAGAHTVVLVPLPEDAIDIVDTFAQKILPGVR
jgi:5,10-methylenetetrahydromethanopterin reductase